MNQLAFLDWHGPEQTFDFVGWNSRRAASTFLDATAFVLDAKGHRQALQLRLPFLKPATYQRDPFPPHPPTRIERFPLLPPPCRPTKGGAEDLLAFVRGGWDAVKFAGGPFTPPAPWEEVYDGEILSATPDDDSELLARLESRKAADRLDYESRKSELAGRTDEEAVRQAANLEETYNAPLQRLMGEDGPLVAGRLNVTLEMVKEGGEILDQYLHERWAKENAFDLREMAQDKKAFLRQWAELTSEVVDVQPTKLGGRMVTKVQNWAGWHDQQLQLLALVVYRIHFADGRRFWLSGCKIRDLQTPEESREFGELLKARLPDSLAASQQASEKPEAALSRGWANEDYSIVRLRGADGAADDIGIPPALRFFLQALDAAEGKTLLASKLTERIGKLRETARAKLDETGYRPQHTLKSKEAKRLVDEGVLFEKRNFREWVYQLKPPAV